MLDDTTIAWFDEAQESIAKLGMEKYEEALKKGIAKECARVLLPLGAQTRLYMKGSVRSWIHYLQVRTDADQVQETQRDPVPQRAAHTLVGVSRNLLPATNDFGITLTKAHLVALVPTALGGVSGVLFVDPRLEQYLL